MNRYQMGTITMLVLVLALSGQAILAGDHGKTTAVVNDTCPIAGAEINQDKVPQELTRVFQEQKVGFCCSGCPEEWDKLNSAEKAEKLDSVKTR